MLRTGVALTPYTSIRIGGRAEAFWEVKSRADLEAAVAWRAERGLDDWVVIGGGANLLINDERDYPLVIKLERRFGAVREEGERIVVEAGVYLPRLVRMGVEAGWGGFELLAGIPGTMGGAVVMNAGIPAFETFDLVLEVRGLDASGGEVRFTPEELEPGYRHGNIPSDVIVTEVALLKQLGDRAAMAATARRLKDERRAKQPLQYPSFGSTFMNPRPRDGSDVNADPRVGSGVNPGRAEGSDGGASRVLRPGQRGTWRSGWGSGAAGALIERAGLKGARRGDAQLSEMHANFVINLGGARARDVLELMILARRTVGERFGVWLIPEVRLVGFTPAELAPLGGEGA